MRLDEDVGKVSQATPVLIAKALECFLEALVKASLVQTNAKQAKKMSLAHVYLYNLSSKMAVLDEPKFDFLADLVKSLPDPTEEDKPKKKRKPKKEAEGEKEEIKS
jgi:Dr1-associated corepressor